MVNINEQERMMLESLRSLPPERVDEVRDFVDFLRSREQGHSERRQWTQVSEAALSRVWDNAEDAAYDQL